MGQGLRQQAILVAGLVAACSGGKMPTSPPDFRWPQREAATDFESFEMGSDPDDAFLDGLPGDADLDGSLDGDGASDSDAFETDAGCKIGTPDDCASCGDRCPGPASSSSTERTCESGKCNISCKGEFYDVNGDAADGCEFADDVPIHDTEESAVDMGAAGDCDPIQKTTAVIPSDDRTHDLAPTQRPQGRSDFFILEVQDTSCVMSAKVTVVLTSLPLTASYEVEASYRCKDGDRLGASKKTVSGGSSVVLDPSTRCTLLGSGDDSGTLFLSVTKTSGPHSDETYEVQIEP